MTTIGVNKTLLQLREEFVRLEEKPVCRVLQVYHSLGVGGAETWLIALLKYLRREQDRLPVRLEVDVCLTGGREEAFDREAASLGARLFYVPFGRANIALFLSRFREILREGKYDAIHDHQDLVAGIHFLSGLGHLPRVRIAHVHNPLYHREKYYRSLFRRLSKLVSAKLLASRATHVLGTSRQLLTEYGFDEPAFSNLQVAAAHCGFDTKSFRGDSEAARQELRREFDWGDESKIILFVGRIDSSECVYHGRPMTHKNPAFALDVAKECIERDGSVRMLFAGRGKLARKDLEATVAKWKLSEKIRFLGVRSDVPRLMLGSDLLLFPSVAEGLGMVVVEAQAAGLRVLASDTTPRECVVLPEMVEFRSLLEHPSVWSEVALDLLASRCPDAHACNSAVKNSPFSIENSAGTLIQLYTGSAISAFAHA